MPNWCGTSYVFYTEGVGRSDLMRLHKTLTNLMKEPSKIENGFEPGWLGKVAIAHNIDFDTIHCRGSIQHLDDFNLEMYSTTNSSLNQGCFFGLQEEAAWSPATKLWEDVVRQYEGVAFVYLSEESGNGYYANSDTSGRFFTDRYLLELCCDDNTIIPDGWLDEKCFPNTNPNCLDIREYFESFDKLQTHLKRLTGKKFSTVKEIEKYLHDMLEVCGKAGVSINRSYIYANIFEFAWE